MKLWKRIVVFFVLLTLGLMLLFFGESAVIKLRLLKEIGKIEEQVEPSVAPEKELKFAVMSDIHLDTENLEKALVLAKVDKVDFVIVTGDMTSLGKKEELKKVKKVLDNSGLEYYVVPGNHDLWASRQFKTDIYSEVFRKDYQSFWQNKVKFILINNGSYFGLGEEQKNWLKEEVKECQYFACLVFAHIPLNHPISLHVMGEDNPKVASEAGEIIRTLVDNKIEQIFVGHVHYSAEYELQGLKTVVVGAITGNRNVQSPKFLEVWEEGNEWNKKEIFLDK